MQSSIEQILVDPEQGITASGQVDRHLQQWFLMTSLRNRTLKTTLAALVLAGGLGCASNRALLIGLDAYQDPRHNLPPIEHDLQKAREITRLLGFQSSETLTLLNEQATRARVLQALDRWVTEGVTASDKVLIYYSGHGTQALDLNGDEDDGCDEAIYPHDQLPVLDDEINAALEKIPAQEVMFIFDACFSGSITRSVDLRAGQPLTGFTAKYVRSGTCNAPINPPRSRDVVLTPPQPPKTLKEGNSTRQRIEITASAHNELSWGSAGTLVNGQLFEGSLFTAVLYEQLKRHPHITFAELGIQVNEAVRLLSQQVGTTGQTPTITLPDAWRHLKVTDFGKLSVQPQALPTPNTTVQNVSSYLRLFQVLKAGSLFGVDMAADRQVYRVGDPIYFEVSSGREGYLHLFEIGTSGKVNLIFPNVLRSDNRIQANTTITVPGSIGGFGFEAGLPTGTETILALVSTFPLNLYTEQVGQHAGGFKTFSDQDLNQLGLTLARRSIGVTQNAAEYGANYLTFEVRH